MAIAGRHGCPESPRSPTGRRTWRRPRETAPTLHERLHRACRSPHAHKCWHRPRWLTSAPAVAESHAQSLGPSVATNGSSHGKPPPPNLRDPKLPACTQMAEGGHAAPCHKTNVRTRDSLCICQGRSTAQDASDMARGLPNTTHIMPKPPSLQGQSGGLLACCQPPNKGIQAPCARNELGWHCCGGRLLRQRLWPKRESKSMPASAARRLPRTWSVSGRIVGPTLTTNNPEQIAVYRSNCGTACL